MSFEVPDTDQVYVSGLPDNTTEKDLADHFGSIGMLKEDKKKGGPKIWLYRDKATGALKGDGTVSYVDPFSAASAVDWFNNKEFKGAVISVSLAESKGQDYSGGRRPAGHGQAGGYGNGSRESWQAPMGIGSVSHAPFPPPPMQMPPPTLGPPPTLAPPPQRDNGIQLPPPGHGSQNHQPSQQAYNPPEFSGGQSYDSNLDPGSFQGQPGMRGPPSGGPPPPKELREGDWLCPGCGNTNFAFRGKCNRCQTGKPGGAGDGGGRGRGRDGGRGGGRDGGGRGRGRMEAAPQGPPGLFTEGDWTCTSCGNTNWARRSTCNLCNGPKPGTVDTNREGHGGGFKELDTAEVEEARRRRQENEDRDMYDEFGRLKKKYRKGEDRKAREAAALARLRGDPVPGEEAREGRSRSRSPVKERAKEQRAEKERARGRDKDRGRDQDRDRGGESERSRRR